MCGIVGSLRFDGTGSADGPLRAMAELLRPPRPRRRGLLGRRPGRLRRTAGCRSSISPASPQPMESVDGRWVLVFNGEIFNYRELRPRAPLPVPDPRRHRGRCWPCLRGARRRRSSSGCGASSPIAARRSATASGWSATGSASCPSTTRPTPSASCSRPRSRRSAAGAPARPRSTRASLDAYLHGARRAGAVHALRRRPEAAARPPACAITADGDLRVEPLLAVPERGPARSGTERRRRAPSRRRSYGRRAQPRWSPTSRSGRYLSGGVDSSLIVALMPRLRGDEPIDDLRRRVR